MYHLQNFYLISEKENFSYLTRVVHPLYFTYIRMQKKISFLFNLITNKHIENHNNDGIYVKFHIFLVLLTFYI